MKKTTNDTYRKTEEAYEQIKEANDEMLQIWKEEVLFTWEWWIGILLLLIPWIIWALFRQKQSTYRLLTAGFFVIIISSGLDYLGVSLGLWHYHWEIAPFIPAFHPWDTSLLPVTIMLFIQFKPKVNPWIKAVIFSVLTAFIAETIFIWAGLYDPEKWKSIYSFPIYMVIYLTAHFIFWREQYDKVEGESK